MGATNLAILSSAAQTATGNSAPFNVPNLKELSVYVDVTAQSGTTPTLTVWLQSSPDDGVTWYDETNLISILNNDGSKTAGSTTANNRNILDVGATTGRSVADYTVFGRTIRARWFIAGTTPSYTFSVRAVGK